MSGMPTLPILRNLIDEYLIGDSALEAFVLDFFPQVQRLYGSGMDRTQKINLLLERASRDQILGSLCQRCPQAANTLGKGEFPGEYNPSIATQADTSGVAIKESRRYFLVMSGTIDELDEPKLRALMSHIRRISGDAELTLEAIKSGSIILQLRGTPEGLARLREAFQTGELKDVLGHRLESISTDTLEMESGLEGQHRLTPDRATPEPESGTSDRFEENVLLRRRRRRQTPEIGIGSSIGPYLIERELNTNGIGQVFLATQPELHRRVAIKLLKRTYVDNLEMVANSLNEARASSSIPRHPSIVKIIEYGQIDGGRPYLIMEYVEGKSLSDRLKEHHPMSEYEAVSISSKIASALVSVHSAGIAHGDLKPANIMIVPDSTTPRGERVKLLDFGIAKLMNDTRIMGTPLYSAPEKFRAPGDIDGKADVYSLGVLLYQLLVGIPPFEDESPVSVIAKHIFITPKPIEQHIPLLSKSLAILVARMLEKDRGNRPSMKEVEGELILLCAKWSSKESKHDDRLAKSGSALMPHNLTSGRGADHTATRRWLKWKWPLLTNQMKINVLISVAVLVILLTLLYLDRR